MSDQQMPKFLRLSQAMHPNNIILKIQLARRDPAIDGLACKGLNLNLGENAEEDRQQQRRSLVVQDVPGQAAYHVSNNLQASIAQHLKDLIYSREWKAIQFEGCAGADRLLVEAPEVSARPSIYFLSIRFSPTIHDGENSPRLFERLWKCWHIQKCRLSLEFTGERLEDFASSSSISQLTALDVTGSTWGQEADDDNDNENENEYNENDNERFGNWRKFCRALVTNHPLLKTFELRNGDLPDFMMKCLIDNAVSPHPSVEELHIPGNSCKEEALHSLSEALASRNFEQSLPLSTRLRSLTISNERLSEDIVTGLREFCASLHHAKLLNSLTLRDYMIHEQDMIALVDSLSELSNIKELSLLSCGLTSQSIRCLCHEGLQRNAIPSLRAVTLPEDAKDAMLTALKDNTSIERLLMEGGLLAQHKYYMDLNRGGRRLLTQSPSITNSLWPTVLARAMHHKSLKFYYGGHKRHLDVLYCFLRNKIALEMETSPL